MELKGRTIAIPITDAEPPIVLGQAERQRLGRRLLSVAADVLEKEGILMSSDRHWTDRLVLVTTTHELRRGLHD